METSLMSLMKAAKFRRQMVRSVAYSDYKKVLGSSPKSQCFANNYTLCEVGNRERVGGYTRSSGPILARQNIKIAPTEQISPKDNRRWGPWPRPSRCPCQLFPLHG